MFFTSSAVHELRISGHSPVANVDGDWLKQHSKQSIKKKVMNQLFFGDLQRLTNTLKPGEKSHMN